jgi:hypothetical protein
MKKMNEETKILIKDACKRLTGYKRRAYQAHITMKYFDESACKAEREMGWGRECVAKGLNEARSGIRCVDNYQGRGIKKNRRHNSRYQRRYNIHCRTSDSGGSCHEKFSDIYKDYRQGS